MIVDRPGWTGTPRRSGLPHSSKLLAANLAASANVRSAHPVVERVDRTNRFLGACERHFRVTVQTRGVVAVEEAAESIALHRCSRLGGRCQYGGGPDFDHCVSSHHDSVASAVREGKQKKVGVLVHAPQSVTGGEKTRSVEKSRGVADEKHISTSMFRRSSRLRRMERRMV